MKHVGEESLSDSSSTSEGESPMTSPNHADIRRISRGQLANALFLAGSASLNSLSNIAQRNAPEVTSELTVPTTSTPSTSTDTTLTLNPNRITNSTLSQAFNSTPATNSNAPTPHETAQFQMELITMREMGLTDERVNLQALILSNGDVSAAINLVFSNTSS